MTEQIEFVLVEAALEPQQQAVIAEARGVNGLLVDQKGVDDPAHLDQLPPVPAVAREARDLSRRNCADLAKAHLRDHPLEPGAGRSARCRQPEILVEPWLQAARAGRHIVASCTALNHGRQADHALDLSRATKWGGPVLWLGTNWPDLLVSLTTALIAIKGGIETLRDARAETKTNAEMAE